MHVHFPSRPTLSSTLNSQFVRWSYAYYNAVYHFTFHHFFEFFSCLQHYNWLVDWLDDIPGPQQHCWRRRCRVPVICSAVRERVRGRVVGRRWRRAGWWRRLPVQSTTTPRRSSPPTVARGQPADADRSATWPPGRDRHLAATAAGAGQTSRTWTSCQSWCQVWRSRC